MRKEIEEGNWGKKMQETKYGIKGKADPEKKRRSYEQKMWQNIMVFQFPADTEDGLKFDNLHSTKHTVFFSITL